MVAIKGCLLYINLATSLDSKISTDITLVMSFEVLTLGENLKDNKSSSLDNCDQRLNTNVVIFLIFHMNFISFSCR